MTSPEKLNGSGGQAKQFQIEVFFSIFCHFIKHLSAGSINEDFQFLMTVRATWVCNLVFEVYKNKH